MTLLPVNVQRDEDAALGSAWRRVAAALPDTATFAVSRKPPGTVWHYVAVTDYDGHSGPSYAYGDTPTVALNHLADALEARAIEE